MPITFVKMGYELHGDVFIRMLNCRHTSASLLVLKYSEEGFGGRAIQKLLLSQVFAGN